MTSAIEARIEPATDARRTRAGRAVTPNDPEEPAVSLDALDLGREVLNRSRIMELLPHRHEMLQLDGILLSDLASLTFAGYRDIGADEFWSRGHFPGNPIFPGVLMVEAAAQLSVVAYKLIFPHLADRLFAFGSMDRVKFRGVVRPGHRLILVCQGTGIRPRACKGRVFGYVDGKLVFESSVLGLPI